MKHIFGPVNSRRFGLSLGVDLSPQEKCCNFDCLYCELGGAKPKQEISNPSPPKTIAAEIEMALKRFENIEVITLTANGEPTLYPYLKELIEKIEKIKKGSKSLILTNASTLWKESVRDSLYSIDMVKLSLDAARAKSFKKIDRPIKGFDFEKALEGVKIFAKNYQKELYIEVLVVEGVNDTPEEFEALNEIIKELSPLRVDVGTVDRPPAYKINGVDYQKLLKLSELIEAAPVSIVHRKKERARKLSLDYSEILRMLKRRPLESEDIEALFDRNSKEKLKKLINRGEIIQKRVGNLIFYGLRIDK